MSELIRNLNSILNTKLAIKAALGTSSDNFEDYPGYISALVPTVSGYGYVTNNGTYNIASYEYVNVNVPIPYGYYYVNDTLTFNAPADNGPYSVDVLNDSYIFIYKEENSIEITQNGIYNPSSFGYYYVGGDINVNVENGSIPDGYTYVSGTYNITANGSYTIASYESVNVNVPNEIPSGYTYVSGNINLPHNGSWNVSSYETAYVDVSVSDLVSGTYNITSNGTFDVSSYQNAYVSVSGGGGASLSGTYCIFNNQNMGEQISVNISNYQPAVVSTYSCTDYNHDSDPMMMQNYTSINIYTWSNGKGTRLNNWSSTFNEDNLQSTDFSLNSTSDICAYTEYWSWAPGEMDPETGMEGPGEYVSTGESIIEIGSSYGTILPSVPAGTHTVWYNHMGFPNMFVLDNWDVSDQFQVSAV